VPGQREIVQRGQDQRGPAPASRCGFEGLQGRTGLAERDGHVLVQR
jgi:hypothetical protein